MSRNKRKMERKRERGMEGKRDGAIKRRTCGENSGIFYFLHLSISLSLFLSIFLSGCARPNPEAEKRAAVDEYFANARSCMPAETSGAEPGNRPRLAIESVTTTAEATRVQLIAYALDEAVDFYAPIYRLSAGRWLINEKGRAYLLDDRCREWKLKDRKPPSGMTSNATTWRAIPVEGRIRLNPGEAVATTLVFAPLPEQTRIGALIYEGRVLPFTTYTKPEQH
jgi:hypothetical protein